LAIPRRCSDCGEVDLSVMVQTASGAMLCGRCWAETTRVPQVRQPATPALDQHIARLEEREARR
jgi:recombinational DNA repair protein (RecF pathway)